MCISIFIDYFIIKINALLSKKYFFLLFNILPYQCALITVAILNLCYQFFSSVGFAATIVLLKFDEYMNYEHIEEIESCNMQDSWWLEIYCEISHLFKKGKNIHSGNMFGCSREAVRVKVKV